jgi:hypothetical protein
VEHGQIIVIFIKGVNQLTLIVKITIINIKEYHGPRWGLPDSRFTCLMLKAFFMMFWREDCMNYYSIRLLSFIYSVSRTRNDSSSAESSFTIFFNLMPVVCIFRYVHSKFS